MGEKQTILVVDDDQDLLELLDLALGDRYRLLVADDGPAALQLLKVARVDAILSDLVMPTMDGVTFLREVRARGFDTPCLLLSAYPEKLRGTAGCVDFFVTLRKPCALEELSEACEEALRAQETKRPEAGW